MTLDDLMKAKKEGRNLPWRTLNENDFKNYYQKFHSGKSRWEVAKEDIAFYDALISRNLADKILPAHKYNLDFELDKFAQEYVETIIPIEILVKKYHISKEKVSHINRYLKKAIDYGIISKQEYKKAVERRQFLNLMGKYFSPQMQDKLFEIASKGYSYIKENQQKIVKDAILDFIKHKKSRNGWLKTNKYFSKKYGKMTYARPITDKQITVIFSKNKMPKEIREERRRLINYLIWFFKIFKPLKHLNNHYK
ncbi:MAG: hypothetical protein QW041_01945 [Candidatus Pacearchaeota archaeon]